ncbi:hypothetical protein HHI36_009739 [Cryptolaemus montrouzieri]|uniref:Uncharacterized protein n=1 Tax=Cryptolaemus montrouzieri TaxID=559131 RepID=A0ABD2MGP9_9CUCU
MKLLDMEPVDGSGGSSGCVFAGRGAGNAGNFGRSAILKQMSESKQSQSRKAAKPENAFSAVFWDQALVKMTGILIQKPVRTQPLRKDG